MILKFHCILVKSSFCACVVKHKNSLDVRFMLFADLFCLSLLKNLSFFSPWRCFYLVDTSSPENSPSVDNSPSKTKGVVLASVAAVSIVILLILYIGWKKRRTSVLMTYTGK